MTLQREQILATKGSLKRETVTVPEWGGDVTVQELTALDRDAFEASCVVTKGKSVATNLVNLRAKLVARSVIDAATGERVFADADAEQLGQLSAAAVNRVFEVAQRLSGLTDADVAELADFSVGGASGGSATASPASLAGPTSMDSSAS